MRRSVGTADRANPCAPTRIHKNTHLGVFIYSWAHGYARAKRMANTQMNKRGRTKTDIFNRVFALRLVIVYQGLVRIPESKNIRLRQVRKLSFDFLSFKTHFRPPYNTLNTFEQSIILQNQHKIALASISVQSGCGVLAIYKILTILFHYFILNADFSVPASTIRASPTSQGLY